MMTALASGSLFKRRATSSNAAFALLSTCAEFFLNSISFSLLASGAAAGTSTFTLALPVAVNPRSSVQVALTETGPACRPAVSRVALPSVPETLPAEATQLAMLTLRPSGLEQVQETVDGLPAVTVVGLAVQEICGGFFGCSFTLKFALHDAVFLAFFVSVIFAVAV